MNKDKTTSIVLVGVGGQGILLASEIVAQAAMAAGYKVKTNEVHGMAQRGGSVVAQIRYGREVYSPLVEKGTAAVLGSLERIEALRFADYLSPEGLCVVNSQAMVPVTVSMGAARYPADAKERLEKRFTRLIYFDAAKVARAAGNARAANTALLGALSTGLDLPGEAWTKAIEMSVPEKYKEVNLIAFERGREKV